MEVIQAYRFALDPTPAVEPGLEFLARWFPEDPQAPVPDFDDLKPFQRTQMAGIARK